jgi:hypothetical protein
LFKVKPERRMVGERRWERSDRAWVTYTPVLEDVQKRIATDDGDLAARLGGAILARDGRMLAMIADHLTARGPRTVGVELESLASLIETSARTNF